MDNTPDNKNTEAVESSASGNPVTGEKSGLLGWLGQRPLTGVVIIVLAAGVITAGWFVYQNMDDSKSVENKAVCTGEAAGTILEEAGASMAPGTIKNLASVTERVQALQDYEQDPNCLNVVITYQIITSDYKKSNETLGKLEKVYDSKVGFSSRLGYDAKSIEEIRDSVSFLKRQSESIQLQGVEVEE